MKVQKLSPTGDWQLGGGEGQYIDRSRAIHQNIATRLRSWRGDFFGDRGHGMRWPEIVGQMGSRRLLRNEAARIVLETEGVVSVDRIEIEVENRTPRVKVIYTDAFRKSDAVFVREDEVA